MQTCLVHVIRKSLDLAAWQQRKVLAGAAAALDAFAASPGGERVKSCRPAWTHVIPFFAVPPEVRHVIYTTNVLESVNARVRKIIKARS